jgi:predicted nucleic acid-binding Zn ribbon protein
MKKQAASSTKALEQAIQELTRSFGIDKKLQQYEAVTRWAIIVGPQIAKETEPQKIEKGLLLVRVRKGVWRNELTMRKSEIIAKLNKAIGSEAVKDIKFQ